MNADQPESASKNASTSLSEASQAAIIAAHPDPKPVTLGSTDPPVDQEANPAGTPTPDIPIATGPGLQSPSDTETSPEPATALEAPLSNTPAPDYEAPVFATGVNLDSPLRAATWQTNSPQEPWCPEALVAILPWAVEFGENYQDNETRELRHEGWRLVAATRRGRMHAHNAEYREDAFACEVGDGVLVIAVSDGAGAYEWSRIGSALTSHAITLSLRDWVSTHRNELSKLDRAALVNAIANQVRIALYEILKGFVEVLSPQSGAKPKDFRCTLLLTVWCRTENAEALITMQVGDGFFGLLGRDGQAARHGEADSGQFSGEVTSFVPDPNALDHATKSIKSHPADELEAILICSDGVEDPFYPIEKNAAVIFHELYHGLPRDTTNAAGVRHSGPVASVLDEHGGDALCTWLAFEKKGENDDRTIVLLHRDPPVPRLRIRTATPTT